MQSSFSELEYAGKKKRTRRDRFLSDLEAITPWAALIEALEPHYPRSGRRGRPPIGVERMLRLYIAQQCFGWSDEGAEDAVCDSQAILRFVGIHLSRKDAPDATTLLKFRRLLEQHGLTQRIFETINTSLAERGLLLKEGTLVDATIIEAPSSTKNREGRRDPQMHQTKKGNQWHFGMKAHIGADADPGLVHTVVATSAEVGDVTQADRLLHGEEPHALGDAGYQGVDRRPERTHRQVRWHVALRPGKRRGLPRDGLGRTRERLEQAKASVRAKVEHPFQVIKQRFGHRKARYRGMAKNQAQLYTLFGLANLVLARRRLLETCA